MRKFLIAALLCLCCVFPLAASEISVGYDGFIVASSDPGVPVTTLALGAGFALPDNAGIVDLSAARASDSKLYTVDVAPYLGSYFYIPFGLTWLEMAGQSEFGANFGVGLRMFPKQALGLKFDARVHQLRNEVAGERTYVDGRAMVTFTF
jgi:hypothetical protein